jgi:hypothetical protein
MSCVSLIASTVHSAGRCDHCSTTSTGTGCGSATKGKSLGLVEIWERTSPQGRELRVIVVKASEIS